MTLDVTRREFVKLAAGAGAALALPTSGHSAASSKMIGIQVGAISFVDEGTEKVLDILQERAGVNTLFLAVFTYGYRGIARTTDPRPTAARPRQAGIRSEFPRRQLCHAASRVLQKHRPQEPARARPRQPRYPCRSAPRRKKARHESHLLARGRLPHRPAEHRESAGARSARAQCRDAVCQQSRLPEFPDPGLVEDYARSYDIDGIMWGSERQGALCDSLGATHDTPPIDPGEVTCFCEFCQRKAKERGINPERARQGFLELEKYVRSARSGTRPVV